MIKLCIKTLLLSILFTSKQGIQYKLVYVNIVKIKNAQV